MADIVVIGSANMKVNEARVDAARELIGDAKVVLLQHEIPQQMVEYASQMDKFTF